MWNRTRSAGARAAGVIVAHGVEGAARSSYRPVHRLVCHPRAARVVTSPLYEVFVTVAAHALRSPTVRCEHLHDGGAAYACLCCDGDVRCRLCHLRHLPDTCPICSAPLQTDLPETHQVEHRFDGHPVADRTVVPEATVVHAEICTSCAIDNDWPTINADGDQR
jgi:hypothetical protein